MSKEIIPRKNTTVKETARNLWHDIKGLGIGIASIAGIVLGVILQILLIIFGFVTMLGYQIYYIIWPNGRKSENNAPAEEKKNFNISFQFSLKPRNKEPKIEEKSAVYVELTLKNSMDAALASQGYIKETEVRQMTVQAVFGAGVPAIIINAETCDKLNLNDLGVREVQLADGQKAEFPMAGPLEVWCKDRRLVCGAVVSPDAPCIMIGPDYLKIMGLGINKAPDAAN
jgi:predicted aspartyl protease